MSGRATAPRAHQLPTLALLAFHGQLSWNPASCLVHYRVPTKV